MSSDLAGLRKSLLNLLKRYKDSVWDIIIFGSFVKEKPRPGDIDVAFIFKKGGMKLAEELSGEVEKISDLVHYNWMFLEKIEKNPLWMTLMLEGYSVKNNKRLSDVFGYRTGVIFSYSLSNLKNKSKFSHALFGRGGNIGKIKEVDGEVLAKGVLLVPMEKSDSFKDFLNYWKVDYKIYRVMIL